jgi:hypothetical protein
MASECVLLSYIRAVCDGDYTGLIRSGDPPQDVLKLAVASLCAEFARLSGNVQTGAINAALRRIYRHMASITALHIAIDMASMGDLDGLRSSGVATSGDVARDIKAAERKIKELGVTLKEETKRFDNVSKSTGVGRSELHDYNDQIAAVSKFAGFHINKHVIMLDEYASYVKQFNLYINDLKEKTNGRHK